MDMRRRDVKVRRGIAVLTLMAAAAEMAEEREEKGDEGASEKETPGEN